MFIPDEVICNICEKVFCCPECRQKHELKNHAIKVGSIDLPVFCPICARRPLVLNEILHSEMLTHIVEKHLPLNCRKCSKLYTKIEDFQHFSKCVYNNISCALEIAASLPNVSQSTDEPTQQPSNCFASTVSTQTSPFRVADINDSHLTPISMINLHWKGKGKITTEEFISDSVSSIKNISSINNSSLRKSIGLVGGPLTKGKLVRSTSTPLQAEIMAKPKAQHFNVSSGHMSSIHNSASDSENSPQLLQQVGHGEIVNPYQRPRQRGKLTTTATPLRQVMSKSIQKAIAEHGIASENQAFNYNRKKIFESIDNSNEAFEKIIENTPLDLRLSPAVRRTQSEIIDRQGQLKYLHKAGKIPSNAMQILLSSTKKTERTESIVITSTSTSESLNENSNFKKSYSTTQSSNSVYQTCRSVEIITSTSTELSEVNIRENEVAYESVGTSSTVPPITPKIPSSGLISNKKVIKFETPVLVDYNKVKTENQSTDELFFTPSSTPLRTSKTKNNFKYFNNNSLSTNQSKKFDIMQKQLNEKNDIPSKATELNLDDDDDEDDDVFVEVKKPLRTRNRLWDLVASVIRLPSLNAGDNQDCATTKNETGFYDHSASFVRRCASFAGSLVRQQSIEDNDRKTVKRKRAHTNDFNFSSYTDSETSDRKRLRIHGRMPIKRMRSNY